MAIQIERDVPVPMRDGAILRADVVRDPQAGQAPCLLMRTPYGKPEFFFAMLSPLVAAERGYAVVVQDCRGTGASDGELRPFVQEIEDGYDSVEWCAAQGWCDGRVGMYGTSYMGATPWLAAIAAPPSLRAVATQMTGSDYHDGWIYEGGALQLGFTLGWVAQFLALPGLRRNGVEGDAFSERERTVLGALARLRETCSELPLDAHPLLKEVAPAPYFFDWLARPQLDEEWRSSSIRAQAARVRVPALSIGGWYDLFAAGPIQTFEAVRSGGATEQAREGQRLLMGPWNHTPGERRVGSVDFGPAAALDLQELVLRWFDWQLRDGEPGDEFASPLRYFTMGANEWREAEGWPPRGVEAESWFLHGGGAANGASGDGRLSRDEPAAEPPDHFLFHPLRPVPTVGAGGRVDGAFDQSRVEERQDVLVYSSAPLERPLEVSGPLRVELFIESSAPETDFTAKLVEVDADGFARNLGDGIARTRYRLVPGEETTLQPGDVHPLTIELRHTSNVFPAGSAIRLEVSSSNFPRFDRNPNTGELAASATRLVPAHQRVHHSAEYPSRLILPVAGRP